MAGTSEGGSAGQSSSSVDSRLIDLGVSKVHIDEAVPYGWFIFASATVGFVSIFCLIVCCSRMCRRSHGGVWRARLTPMISLVMSKPGRYGQACVYILALNLLLFDLLFSPSSNSFQQSLVYGWICVPFFVLVLYSHHWPFAFIGAVASFPVMTIFWSLVFTPSKWGVFDYSAELALWPKPADDPTAKPPSAFTFALEIDHFYAPILHSVAQLPTLICATIIFLDFFGRFLMNVLPECGIRRVLSNTWLLKEADTAYWEHVRTLLRAPSAAIEPSEAEQKAIDEEEARKAARPPYIKIPCIVGSAIVNAFVGIWDWYNRRQAKAVMWNPRVIIAILGGLCVSLNAAVIYWIGWAWAVVGILSILKAISFIPQVPGVLGEKWLDDIIGYSCLGVGALCALIALGVALGCMIRAMHVARRHQLAFRRGILPVPHANANNFPIAEAPLYPAFQIAFNALSTLSLAVLLTCILVPTATFLALWTAVPSVAKLINQQINAAITIGIVSFLLPFLIKQGVVILNKMLITDGRFTIRHPHLLGITDFVILYTGLVSGMFKFLRITFLTNILVLFANVFRMDKPSMPQGMEHRDAKFLAWASAMIEFHVYNNPVCHVVCRMLMDDVRPRRFGKYDLRRRAWYPGGKTLPATYGKKPMEPLPTERSGSADIAENPREELRAEIRAIRRALRHHHGGRLGGIKRGFSQAKSKTLMIASSVADASKKAAESTKKVLNRGSGRFDSTSSKTDDDSNGIELAVKPGSADGAGTGVDASDEVVVGIPIEEEEIEPEHMALLRTLESVQARMRARNRWHLAIILWRFPFLKMLRKHSLAEMRLDEGDATTQSILQRHWMREPEIDPRSMRVKLMSAKDSVRLGVGSFGGWLKIRSMQLRAAALVALEKRLQQDEERTLADAEVAVDAIDVDDGVTTTLLPTAKVMQRRMSTQDVVTRQSMTTARRLTALYDARRESMPTRRTSRVASQGAGGAGVAHDNVESGQAEDGPSAVIVAPPILESVETVSDDEQAEPNTDVSEHASDATANTKDNDGSSEVGL